jgi:hypothetical protein
MHKTVLAAALAIGLVACDPTLKPVVTPTLVGTIGGQSFAQVFPQFSDAVRIGCRFAIAGYDLAGFTGNYPTVEAAAQAFCASLQTKQVRRGVGGSINFQGAVISGRRL